jgi:uncharacterized RDD family membrane protein YckC
MERSLDVRTAESIALRYELAGLGSRFLAMMLDFGIQIAVTLAIVTAFAIWGLSLHGAPKGHNIDAYPSSVQTFAYAVVYGFLALAIFVWYFGYFIVFEVWWGGRTPGKRVLGIRVVRDGGFPVDIGSSVVRNVVRVGEFALGFYALSAISALASRQNKRLGDFAAGTIVVRDRRYEATDIAAFGAAERADDDGLTREERELVERYVARRKTLEPRARVTLAARIADRVRPHLRASFDHLDDDALLQHLGRGVP